jgi:hypothetical protein
VQEGEEAWGTEGRSRRSKGAAEKKIKKVVDPGSGEDEDGDEEEEEDLPPARAPRASRMDLAFLGDESDSDD